MNNDRCVYAEHKHCFAHIGVDLFRDINTGSIWHIEHNSDENIDYIVRTNLISEEMQQVGSSWKAVPDRARHNVTLFYKNVPVKRFANDMFRFDSATAMDFCHYLVYQAEQHNFVKKLFSTLSESKRDGLYHKFAELRD